MDIIKATILKGNINDELWPEIVLAMTYIKNNCPMRAFASNAISHKAQNQENITNMSYL